MEILVGAIGLIGAIVVIALLAAIWRAFVLTKLWVWFVVPIFPTMPVLGKAQMYGLSLAITLLTFSGSAAAEEPDKDKRHLKAALNLTLVPLLFLGTGWIVKTYFL